MASPAAALLSRAAAALRAGRPADAVAPLREAAALHPDSASIQHDYGLACLETGHLPEAVAALRAAVALDPHHADAYFRLAIALEHAGDTGGAIVAYDRATTLLPSLTEAWFRAGALVFTLGHREEAIGCFRRAAATGPKTRFGRLSRARALLAEERDAEAETVLRRMLALEPANAIAHDLLGNILADAGRFDEARACFARAIANGPLMAGCYYDLVRCRRLRPDEADLLPAMRAALDVPGLQVEQRVRVHLALGKAADDFGDHATAMREYDAAEAVRRTMTAFDAAAFAALVERIIARFTPDAMAAVAARGRDDATPVLIVGMPRSGTTLTEQIVSSHPAVAGGGELTFWTDRGASLLAGDAVVDGDRLDRVAEDYLSVLRGIGRHAARVTDKMPFNFIWAGLVHLAFPRAMIIHCRRAAIDTALSIHQTHFNPRLAFPTGGADLVAYFRGYDRLTEHWRRVLPEDRFVEIDYEKLTSEPERVIRQIIAACGLPWSDACLRPELNARAVKTPSRWQARQPIYRDAVARWRRYEPWLGSLGALLETEMLPSAGATPRSPEGA